MRNEAAIKKPSLRVTLPLPRLISSQAPPLLLLPPPKIKSETFSKAQAKPASRNPRKRAAAPADDDDEFDSFTPSSRQEPAPKKQRVAPSVRKPKAGPKTKTTVDLEEDHRPEPRGRPEVWAEVLIILSWPARI